MSEDHARTDRERNGRFVKTLESAERDREACRLRARGLTYQAISDQLGYGAESAARRAVKECIDAVRAEGGRELKAIQRDQLDYLTRQVLAVLERQHLTITQAGKIVTVDGAPVIDDAPVLAATDRLLRIMERRAKLEGMDAPERREVLTLDAIDAEIAALSAELDRDPASAPEGTA